MPKIQYKETRFTAKVEKIIGQANTIIAEYRAQGYDLTLRQLYYQFVSRDLLRNVHQEYKRLGSIINDARLAGLIDWDAITDRTRNLHALGHWDQPSEIVKACADQFQVDMWEGQTNRIEIWIEKEALAGVFQRVCDRLDLPFFSCRGYTSASEMWSAAQRLKAWEEEGYETQIFHFGDHDPSGLDMTRDIIERLKMFGSAVQVERVALTMDQIEEHKPPPNPAKMTDSRADGYVEECGDESWELDALDPGILAGLVEEHALDLRDEGLWLKQVKKQKAARQNLTMVANRWSDVQEFLKA